VLDDLLGYEVPDHLVDIRYYRPRGDAKEAWDNVDLIGFMGRTMQVKINFLCRDSVLAAPLVIELIRLMDLARRRGERGVQEQFGTFFKSPLTRNGGAAEHALHRQEERLGTWLVEADERC
jgi:myo-inositol-1-phosphate synthase